MIATLKLSGVCRIEERGGDGVVRGFDRLIERFERAPAVDSRGAKYDGRAIVTAGELLFEILKAPIDIERQSAGDDFQPFAPPLPLSIAILLNNANGEPAEDADGKQDRDGEKKGKFSPMCPGHGAPILRVQRPRRGQRFVTNTSARVAC